VSGAVLHFEFARPRFAAREPLEESASDVVGPGHHYDVQDVLPHHLRRRPFEKLLGIRIPVSDVSVEIGGNDGLFDRIEEGALKADALRRGAMFGDVFDDSDDTDEPAAVVRCGGKRHVSPYDATVFPEITAIERREFRLAADERLEPLGAHGRVIRMTDARKGRPDELGLVVSDDLAETAVDADETSVRTSYGDAYVGMLEGKPITLFKLLVGRAHVRQAARTMYCKVKSSSAPAGSAVRLTEPHVTQTQPRQ
jgi:hypothetical protein